VQKNIRDNHHLKGFTLVEIMIVVAVIALLAAFAIPNFLRARVSANETAAQSSLRTVHTAVESYKSVGTSYPSDLSILSSSTPPYIDSVLGAGSKQGYSFVLTGLANTFTATARPQTFGRTGERSFYVDESAVIRYTHENRDPTSADSPIIP